MVHEVNGRLPPTTTTGSPTHPVVLTAAFLTYVAAAISSLMTFRYYLMRAGLLGGRRND